MKTRILLFVCAIMVTVTTAQQLPRPRFADLILTRGNIITVNPRQPQATAVAVWGGRIMWVGVTSDIRDFVGPTTKLIDLKERTVLPGFNDSHVHFMTGGFHLLGVDLRNASNEEEF